MALPADTDENMRLIRSLLVCVNAPYPRTLSAAYEPFGWALEAARSRKKDLQHRINFHADDPSEQAKTLALAQGARGLARGILWWLATTNDAELDEPVLHASGKAPKVRWYGLERADVALLEAPLVFRHFKVKGQDVVPQELAIWDRPSTCIAHALDLLLTDYLGLRARVRACPFMQRGTIPELKVEDIRRNHFLHFFVDDRFEKGQAQLYCKPQHRQTAYMRKYRSEQAAAKHK